MFLSVSGLQSVGTRARQFVDVEVVTHDEE